MGGLPSKQDEKLYYINKEVNLVRSSIRGSRRSLSKESKEGIIKNLVKTSTEAEALHGKVKQKKLDQTRKNISQTMNELLTITPRESQLDMGAIESNSFVQMPVSKRRSLGSTDSLPIKYAKSLPENNIDHKKSKSLGKIIQPSLKDIELKLNSLKPKIEYAIEAKDTKQLRFLDQTIKLLAGDLELISADEGTPFAEQKRSVEKQLATSYQKITKANKEFKRNNDIQYLSGKSKKDKANKTLDQIEKNLEENESLLKWAVETKENETMVRIKENVIKDNQKLSEVELVDDEIKEKETRLHGKAIGIVKTIEDNLKKYNFEKDVSLADTSYSELIEDVRNNGNKEDLSKKLRNLKNFVNNLEPFDSDSKEKKENLFNKVERTLFNVISSLKKVEDQKTVADIVEENVILRNKQKRDVSELERFYQHWRSVSSNFDVNTYSKDVLVKIDAILQEMHISIAELRKKISIQNNFSTQNSASTPHLASFGSVQSLDDESPGIIKVKTKYYNISSPELKSVVDHPPINFVEFDSSVFSKIEEIKTQVYYLKEKISECQNTQHLKNKLESYIQILKKYLFHKNQTIANNAKIVTNDVNDLLSDLSTKQNVPSRRISIEDNFEDIVGIQETLEALEKEVQTFYGDRNNINYERLKMALLECKSNLERIRVSSRYEMVQQQKEELLKNCSSLVAILENRAANYSIYEENMIRERKNSLDRLKDKVNRFSGTYKGVLYNKIEMDLNKLLLRVNEGIESKNVSDDIAREVEKYLNILEQRAAKAQSFRKDLNPVLRSSEQINMLKIKNDLISIKREIDLTPDSNAEAFVRLKSRLDLVNLELDQIGTRSNEALEKDKEIFANEAQTLKNHVEAKIALASQRPTQDLGKKTSLKLVKIDPIKDLKHIEADFLLLKNEVNDFEGVHLDDKYFSLDKRLHSLITRLDKHHFTKGTDIYTHKLNLSKEMHQCLRDLDKKAKELEMVLKIENELRGIEAKFEKERNKKSFAEQLKNLKSSIEKSDIPVHLEQRKKACLDKVVYLLDKIAKEENKNRDEVVLTDAEETFRKLKPEIETFVGLSSDSKFVELDEIIMNLIIKLDKYEFPKASDLYLRKINLLKELHKYNAILDDRAKETENIVDIEQSIEKINFLVSSIDENSMDKNDLKDKILKIQQTVNSVNVNKELTERKHICQQKISLIYSKFNTVKTDSVKENNERHSGYNSVVYNFAKNTENELAKISKSVEQLRGDIDKFSSAEGSESYQAIDDVLSKLTFQLNQLKISKESSLYPTKLALMQKIQDFTDILDEKAQETQSLLKIEQEIDELAKKMSQENSEEFRNNIDEKLIQLQVKLGRLSVSETLRPRKEECNARLLNLMKILKEEQSSQDSYDSGTQI